MSSPETRTQFVRVDSPAKIETMAIWELKRDLGGHKQLNYWHQHAQFEFYTNLLSEPCEVMLIPKWSQSE